jgi:hypothetical protein
MQPPVAGTTVAEVKRVMKEAVSGRYVFFLGQLASRLEAPVPTTTGHYTRPPRLLPVFDTYRPSLLVELATQLPRGSAAYAALRDLTMLSGVVFDAAVDEIA